MSGSVLDRAASVIRDGPCAHGVTVCYGREITLSVVRGQGKRVFTPSSPLRAGEVTGDLSRQTEERSGCWRQLEWLGVKEEGDDRHCA